jgi:hypothetical protein
VICPASMECQTRLVKARALLLDTRDRDVPRVTLIKGSRIYDNVHVLSGKCTLCQTKYYADHESSKSNGTHNEILSMKLCKISQSGTECLG